MNWNMIALENLTLAQASAPETVETVAAPSTGEAPANAPAKEPPPGILAGPWIPLLLILLMAWLLIFRPKNQTEKKRIQMLNSLKKGDRIQTIGGIIGTVVDVRDDEVLVKVDETSNTKITFSRNAIHRVREQDKK